MLRIWIIEWHRIGEEIRFFDIVLQRIYPSGKKFGRYVRLASSHPRYQELAELIKQTADILRWDGWHQRAMTSDMWEYRFLALELDTLTLALLNVKPPRNLEGEKVKPWIVETAIKALRFEIENRMGNHEARAERA